MKKNILWLAAITTCFALSLLAGCNKGDEAKPTTVEEDKANIQASFDRVKNLIQNFRDGSLYNFIDEAMVEPYGIAASNFAEELTEKLDQLVNFEQVEKQHRFNMVNFAGKYTWNSSTKQWTKAAQSNIQVLFPSAANGTANNCELNVTAYEDKACDIEGTTTYLPTNISADFKKDNVKLASIDAKGDYTSYGIPKNISVNAYAKPLALSASLTQASASKYSAALSVTDEAGENNSLSISGEAVLSTAVNSYTDFSDCEINNLKFTLTQAALSINGTIDLKMLNKLSDPSVADINACINLEVFYNGAAVGTLRVQEVGGSNYLFIVYKDETKENTEVYYDSFVTDIENMFKK